MITEKKALEIGQECLNEMYKASTPPITWKQVIKKYAKTNTRFFLKHKISEKDYSRIKSKYLKKIGKYWANDLGWLLLDFSPTLEII